jgi:hypothetical protein
MSEKEKYPDSSGGKLGVGLALSIRKKSPVSKVTQLGGNGPKTSRSAI